MGLPRFRIHLEVSYDTRRAPLIMKLTSSPQLVHFSMDWRGVPVVAGSHDPSNDWPDDSC